MIHPRDGHAVANADFLGGERLGEQFPSLGFVTGQQP
jgi:hypothetical protein